MTVIGNVVLFTLGALLVGGVLLSGIRTVVPAHAGSVRLTKAMITRSHQLVSLDRLSVIWVATVGNFLDAATLSLAKLTASPTNGLTPGGPYGPAA